MTSLASKTLSQTIKLPQIRKKKKKGPKPISGKLEELFKQRYLHILAIPSPRRTPSRIRSRDSGVRQTYSFAPSQESKKGRGTTNDKENQTDQNYKFKTSLCYRDSGKKNWGWGRVGINHNLEIGTWYRFFAHVISPKPCNCPVRTQGSERVVCPLATVHSTRVCFPAPPSYCPGGTLHYSRCIGTHTGQRHAR